MEKIKELSIERIRENCDVPSLGDDLLLFSELKMLPQLDEPRRTALSWLSAPEVRVVTF